MPRTFVRHVACLLVLSVLGTAQAAPTTYRVSQLEGPPRFGKTWVHNVFYGMSHRNRVMVGVTSPIDDAGSRVFVFKDGVMRYLPTETSNDRAYWVDSHGNALGARSALDGSNHQDVRWRADGSVDVLQSTSDAQGIRLQGISDKAEAVGMVYDVQAYLSSRAAVWEGTSSIELPLPEDVRGNAFSEAMAISPNGRHIVGVLKDAVSGTPHALVHWKDRQPMVVNTGRYLSPYPVGVNDRGEVAFNVGPHTLTIPFKLDAQGLHQLEPLIPGTDANASAINKDGLVGGTSDCQCVDRWHAVIWKGRRALDLNDMLDPVSKADGWVVNWVYDIDDAGVIFAAGDNPNLPQASGYILLTPH